MSIQDAHVLYEVDQWLTVGEKRVLCLASKEYWLLFYKRKSAYMVNLGPRGGWKTPWPSTPSIAKTDYTRLVLLQLPRHAEDLEAMMRHMRQRQSFMKRRFAHIQDELPNLDTIELWGRACALKHVLAADYRIVLHSEPPPVSTRRSTRCRP